MSAIFDDAFMQQLESMSISVDAKLRGFLGGTHRTLSHGSTTEFADFREYVLGDDVRRIDWNIYSRFEKYFVRLYVDERQMHTRILLDCSASVNESPEKSLCALRVAAALGFLSVHGMDKVSYYKIGDTLLENIGEVVTNKDSFYTSLKLLETVPFTGAADFEGAILKYPDLGMNDGLTVIISDFLTDNNWKKAVDYLLYRKHRVLLVQILSPRELNPDDRGRTNFLDCEAVGAFAEGHHLEINISKSDLAAYQMGLKEMFDDIKDFCRSKQVSYIFMSSAEQPERVFLEKLYAIGVVK